MASVKQASPQLAVCQAHVKERSIFRDRVKPLVDEGRGGGAVIVSGGFYLRDRVQCAVQQWSKRENGCRKTNLSRAVRQPPPSTLSPDVRPTSFTPRAGNIFS